MKVLTPEFPLQRLALLSVAALLVGCSSTPPASSASSGSSDFDVSLIYRPEVVQGNFVSKEQMSALKPGMTREEVVDVLGSPLLVSLFHADRWDYVFTMKRQGAKFQEKKLALFFKAGRLERIEGDDMMTEAQFVRYVMDTNSRWFSTKPSTKQLELTEAEKVVMKKWR